MNMELSERLSHAYLFAKKYVISKGYASEIDWQSSLSYESIDEKIFLHEMCWVILASGMNDKVVRKIFPVIKSIMFDFESSALICEKKQSCLNNALKTFNHYGKISAILYVAEYIQQYSFEIVKLNLKNKGIEFIKTFPYMGAATSFHLAKNIGLDVVKPDRHLIRLSTLLGFETPNELCSIISIQIQEKVSLVDLVLWRYATLDKNYVENVNRFIINKTSKSTYNN